MVVCRVHLKIPNERKIIEKKHQANELLTIIKSKVKTDFEKKKKIMENYPPTKNDESCC